MTKREFIKMCLNCKWHWLNCSFSQEGEDIILDNLLEKRDPFYIDIGAYHPYRFSNTMRFYLRGGRGLNIDATPGSMKLFNKWRRRDINIEAAITSKEGERLEYYIYKEGGLNTFDNDRVDYLKGEGYEYLTKVEINTFSINNILERYLPEGQEIDFLDVDIEGLDEVVVSSLDFEKYKPRFILSENFSIDSKTNNTLVENGYVLCAFTGRTAIYRRSD